MPLRLEGRCVVQTLLYLLAADRLQIVAFCNSVRLLRLVALEKGIVSKKRCSKLVTISQQISVASHNTGKHDL